MLPLAVLDWPAALAHHFQVALDRISGHLEGFFSSLTLGHDIGQVRHGDNEAPLRLSDEDNLVLVLGIHVLLKRTHEIKRSTRIRSFRGEPVIVGRCVAALRGSLDADLK